jgi:hypothetical protein
MAKDQLDVELHESINGKDDTKIQEAGVQYAVTYEDVQARYPLLRDLSREDMDTLNKRVLRKVDWRLMPCITVMFLMK